jgi:hypothetical protein
MDAGDTVAPRRKSGAPERTRSAHQVDKNVSKLVELARFLSGVARAGNNQVPVHLRAFP